jgi:hypothetical protein
MDFMSGFPRTKRGHEHLFVIEDMFSKMCILVPCKKTIKGQYAAIMFFKKVWVHSKIPWSIILDKYTIFLIAFRLHFGKIWAPS